MLAPTADVVLSNAHVYREIAEDAQQRSQASLEAHRSPKDDGSPGYVLTRDPNQASFKNSMIAIVFAGMTMEARLWLFGCARVGVAQYKRLDKKPLEERLGPLGIADDILFEEVKAFREARAALVHEKALPISQDRSPIRIAQEEAAKAVVVMTRVLAAIQRSVK